MFYCIIWILKLKKNVSRFSQAWTVKVIQEIQNNRCDLSSWMKHINSISISETCPYTTTIPGPPVQRLKITKNLTKMLPFFTNFSNKSKRKLVQKCTSISNYQYLWYLFICWKIIKFQNFSGARPEVVDPSKLWTAVRKTNIFEIGKCLTLSPSAMFYLHILYVNIYKRQLVN